jgi:hypothetical protein
VVGLKSLSLCGRYNVSTIAMREPMPDGRSFETVVFDLQLNDEVDSRRYDTWAQAEAGHDQLLMQFGPIETALGHEPLSPDDRWTRAIARASASRARPGPTRSAITAVRTGPAVALTAGWRASSTGCHSRQSAQATTPAGTLSQPCCARYRGTLCPHGCATGQEPRSDGDAFNNHEA